MNFKFEYLIIISVLLTIPTLFISSKNKLGSIVLLLSTLPTLMLSAAVTYLGEMEIGNIFYLYGKKLLVVQSLGALIFAFNIRAFINNKLTNIQAFISNVLFLAILFIFSSLDFLSLYFCLATVTLCNIFYSSNKKISSIVNLFFQTIVTELTLIMGILFFIAGTGSINLVNISIINHEYLGLSYIFLLAYTYFKLAVFPFHSWLPIIVQDVKDGAIVLYGVVISTFSLVLIPILQKLLVELEPQFQNRFTLFINLIVLLSTFYGLFLAWKHKKIEKSFAYYSIAPLTLILLSINIEPSEEFFLKQIYYTLFTGVTLGLASVLIGELSRHNIDENTSDIRGTFYSSKLKSILLIILLMSTLGIPLTVGFSVKMGLMLSFLDSGLAYQAVILSLSTVFAFIIISDYISQIFSKDEDSYPAEIIGNNFPAHLIEILIILSVIIGGVIPTLI